MAGLYIPVDRCSGLIRWGLAILSTALRNIHKLPAAIIGLSHHYYKNSPLKARNFSDSGNFGFGIDEHIDLGIKYDPSTGIYGCDFYIVMTRAGRRVARRKHCRAKIGVKQRVTKDDTINWFKEKFEGVIV